MTAVPKASNSGLERSVQRYRRLLWLYPASFRDEYGEDLVQAHRDMLLHSADARGLCWRTARDLVGSSVRERAAVLSPRNRPSAWLVAAIVLAALLGLLVVGGSQILLLPAVVFLGLPVFGVSRFWNAFSVRRSTGGPIMGDILLGVACILPAAVFFAIFGEDAGYWLFIAISGTLIISAAVGIVWAAVALLRRPAAGTRRPWGRAALAAVPSIAVLAFIIGASVNSYLRTIGPAGDHSVENASAESRELWAAAGNGYLSEVERITADTCADPWVRYVADEHGNRENARGHAIVNGHPQVEEHLDRYMDEWFDRCGETG